MKENRSVTRILQILELISKHPEGLTLGQVYRMLDIPKATAYDFLQTLYQTDAVYYKDPRLKNYVIGSKMFSIGSVYTKNSSLIEAAQFELKNFGERYGKTVLISKRIEEKIVYVYKYQPLNSRISLPVEIGSMTHDFEHDIVGLCYKTFDRHFNGSKNPEEVLLKKRFVQSETQDNSHVYTIAIPVWNFENRCVGVLSASDLAGDDAKSEQMIKDFISIATEVSRKLGFIKNI